MASISNNTTSPTTSTQASNYVNFSEIRVGSQPEKTTTTSHQMAQTHTANDGQMYKDYDQGYGAYGDSKSYVNNYEVIKETAQKTDEPSTPKKTSSLFRRLFPSKKQPIDQAKNPTLRKFEANVTLKSIGAIKEEKARVEKLKENAQTVGDVVLNILKTSGKKKAELRIKGSVELELAGLGNVTVLKSSRNPFRRGSLYVRFNGQAHLGTGTFKNVELGIQIKSLNRAIPVAIAKAKVKSDTTVLRKEHEISQKMKGLFGGTIFASKKMVNLRNGEQGFAMPLSHGNYRSPKAKNAKGNTDYSIRTGIEKLPMGKKVQNARAILDTIRKMEEKGYVHADFKEDNIFLDADGNAQIADWGVFYTRNDFTKVTTETLEQLEKAVNEADGKGETEKAKGLQTELNNLRSSFDELVRKAKLNWACAVFESFSADEWKQVKDEIIGLFGSEPKMDWSDTILPTIPRPRKKA